MGKRLNITEKTRQDAIAFYLATHSLNETAKEFGFSCRQTVKRILADERVPLHDRETSKALAKANCKRSILKKYGVENAFCAAEAKEKIKEARGKKLTEEQEQEIVAFYLAPNSIAKTAREFGLSRTYITSLLRRRDIQFHGKSTCFELRSKESEATCLAKYGASNAGKCPAVQRKARRTCLERYGAETPLGSKMIREKIKHTCLERYGAENPFAAAEVRSKIKETCASRYGVEWYQQTEEARLRAKKTYVAKKELLIELSRKSRNKRYITRDLAFDSLPELAFFVCNLEDGAKVEREPCRLEYEAAGKKHEYFPDFRVDGKLYEIKGDHFLGKNGEWKNPFDRSKDEIWEAKRQCALRNGVAILYSAEYSKYVDRFLATHDISDFLPGKQGQAPFATKA